MHRAYLEMAKTQGQQTRGINVTATCLIQAPQELLVAQQHDSIANSKSNFTEESQRKHTCNRDCLSMIVNHLPKICFHPKAHDSGQVGLFPVLWPHPPTLTRSDLPGLYFYQLLDLGQIESGLNFHQSLTV